jgi:ABC-2 type transport system ATP-binding protein
MSEAVIQTVNLTKDHFSPFLRKKFRGLENLSLDVYKGETFGLLGPNGAGKTTTIKLMLGLIRPTTGTVNIFGIQAGDPKALSRLGYLPENPYFYMHLTAMEFLEFAGLIFGMNAKQRRERAKELLEMVSMSHAANIAVRKYSKGMMQRLGIAQSLMNDPELVFYDEPMSGLDPIGRRDVRKIMQGLKDRGKTVFFNTHLLPDVNELCDRIAVLSHGKLVGTGTVSEISQGSYQNLEDYFMELVTQHNPMREVSP